MNILIFSALNFGVGIALGLLTFMAIYHLHRGYRFSPKQEIVVLKLFRVGAGGLCVNLVMSGLLGTVATFSKITEELPVLAIVPLLGKFVGGVGLWLLIFWVQIYFYPTQKR